MVSFFVVWFGLVPSYWRKKAMPYVVQCVKKTNSEGFDVKPLGEYNELKEAILAAMQVIDHFLSIEYSYGISSDELFEKYRTKGVVPYIFGGLAMTTQISGFNHFEYAGRRCKEIARKKHA
jgi:hypothetical protein